MVEGYTPGQVTAGTIGLAVVVLVTMGLSPEIAVAGPLLTAPAIYVLFRYQPFNGGSAGHA